MIVPPMRLVSPPPRRSVTRPESGHGERGADALRDQQQAGHDGVLAADELEVQRHQDHAAEQRGAEARTWSPRRRRTPCWRTGGRRAAGSGCCSARMTKVATSAMPVRAGTRTSGGGHRAGGAALGEAVGDADEAGGDEREAGGVELAGGLRARASCGSRRQRGDHGDDADRDVDEEDRLPADVLDEQAAERGAEDGGEDDRDADRAHHARHVARAGGLDERDLADRDQQAAGEALQDARGDERLEVPGEPAERGAGGEEDEARGCRGGGRRSGRRPSRRRG